METSPIRITDPLAQQFSACANTYWAIYGPPIDPMPYSIYAKELARANYGIAEAMRAIDRSQSTIPFNMPSIAQLSRAHTHAIRALNNLSAPNQTGPIAAQTYLSAYITAIDPQHHRCCIRCADDQPRVMPMQLDKQYKYSPFEQLLRAIIAREKLSLTSISLSD